MRIVSSVIVFATLLMITSFLMVSALDVKASETPQFLVYKMTVPSVNREYAEDIATRIFNIPNAVVEYKEGLYMIRSDSKDLHVYETSGAILYVDWSKIYNESYAPNLPSEVEGRRIAEEFLKKYELMPKEAYFKGINYSTSSIFYRDTKQVESIVNAMDVTFGFRTAEGISIEGPGAKIRVSLGEGGEIIGFHWAWRSIESYEYRSGISRSRAIDEYCNGLSDPVKLEVRFAYYIEPGYIEQEYLQPYYIFDYETIVDGKPLVSRTQKMSALSLPTTQSNSQLAGALILPIFMAATAGLFLVKKSGVSALLLIAVVGLSIFTASTPIVSAIPNDDGNNREVGDEWVCAYPPPNTLQHCDEDARGFRNQLTSIGWTPSFDLGDRMAWEQTFKYRNGPGGGTDFAFIDAVDFAYFAGHGSVNTDPNEALIWFSVNNDFWSFSSNNARWGGDNGGQSGDEADLEFIVLDACLTLQETPNVFGRWDQAFCGLHYILGFHTACGDTGNQGPSYGWWLRMGYTISEAWILATIQAQSSGVYGAYLRADPGTANDKINPYSVGSDPFFYYTLHYFKWVC